MMQKNWAYDAQRQVSQEKHNRFCSRDLGKSSAVAGDKSIIRKNFRPTYFTLATMKVIALSEMNRGEECKEQIIKVGISRYLYRGS